MSGLALVLFGRAFFCFSLCTTPIYVFRVRISVVKITGWRVCRGRVHMIVARSCSQSAIISVPFHSGTTAKSAGYWNIF